MRRFEDMTAILDYPEHLRKGTRRASRLSRLLNHAGAFLPAIGATYLAAILSYLFVWIVDPYALRPWGAKVQVSEHPYQDQVLPMLIGAAAQDGSDLVVVGGSTAMGYTTAILREAFPEVRKPINLSFTGPSARDFETELAILDKSKTLKRVIFSLDWSLLRDVPGFGRIWNKPPYDGSWFRPVPEFGFDAIRASAHVLRTGALDMPDWLSQSADQPDFIRGSQRITASPERVAKLVRAVEVSRTWITQGRPIACDAIPNLLSVIPYIKRMAARGVYVDVLLPPYSLALYSDWALNSPPALLGTSFGEQGVFASLVSLRRCAVELTSGISNVRVHAFDTDLPITSNLSLYIDTSHILDYQTYRYFMLRIAQGNAILTKEEWPQYEASLKAAVQGFKPVVNGL